MPLPSTPWALHGCALRCRIGLVLGCTLVLGCPLVMGCTEPPTYVFPSSAEDKGSTTSNHSPEAEGSTNSPEPTSDSAVDGKSTEDEPDTSSTAGIPEDDTGWGETTTEGDDGATSAGGAEPTSFCHVHLYVPEVSNECFSMGQAVYVWSDATDGGGSKVNDAVEVNRSLCFDGVAGQVIDGQYDVTYGAGMGIMLAQEDAAGTYLPLDLRAQGVQGVDFIAALYPDDVQVRFEATMRDPSGERFTYCSLDMTVHPGENRVWLSDLQQSCWAGPLDFDASLDLSQVEAIQWHVITNGESATPFEMCVSDLRFFY